jgi:hypothetical protein
VRKAVGDTEAPDNQGLIPVGQQTHHRQRSRRRWVAQVGALFEVSALLLATLAGAFALRTAPFAQGQGPLMLNLLGHLAFILAPVLWLLITRRELAGYGLRIDQLHQEWQVTMTAYLPIALGAATLGFLDYKAWPGALFKAAIEIGVLVAVGRVLTRQLDPKAGYVTLSQSSH